MELKEGLEFYQRCIEYCKQTITELMKDESIPKEKKEVLIDKLLIRMTDLQKRIDTIEELLR